MQAQRARWVTRQHGSGLSAGGSNRKDQAMVKVNGPMFSLDASGTLADAITFSKWKGRPYVRERVIPSNPKSGAQTGRRAMFKFLTQFWQLQNTAAKATWQTIADQIIASPFNAYLKDNMEYWHNFLPPSQEAPRAAAGTPSDNVLTAAAWEENRIKLTFAGVVIGDNWGKVIYAALTTGFTNSVGSTILVEPDTTIASHDVYWTPPAVDTYFFNSTTFADDGVMAAAGGEQSAVPP